MHEGATFELSYDAVADSLSVRLAAAPPDVAVRRRELEGGLLVVHGLPDGRPVAWEIRQASLHGPLVAEILSRLHELSGALDTLAETVPTGFEAFLAWEAAQEAPFERLDGEGPPQGRR